MIRNRADILHAWTNSSRIIGDASSGYPPGVDGHSAASTARRSIKSNGGKTSLIILSWTFIALQVCFLINISQATVASSANYKAALRLLLREQGPLLKAFTVVKFVFSLPSTMRLKFSCFQERVLFDRVMAKYSAAQ